MMNADVLGMTATEMRAGPPWDQNPKPRSFQLRARGGPSLCSTRTQAWGRKVIWTGADARTQQQQGQKTGGDMTDISKLCHVNEELEVVCVMLSFAEPK